MALDNSVLGDVTDVRIPEKKKADKEAMEKIIELAWQKKFELGIALTGAAMEMQRAGERTRNALVNKLGGILKKWPVVGTSEIQRKTKCLEKIMRDQGGIDSRIFVASTLHAQYFLTTDYRYLRRFKKQERRIREECGITAQILTPSDFLAEYMGGSVSCFQTDT